MIEEIIHVIIFSGSSQGNAPW